MSMIIVTTLVFVNPLYVFAKMQQISILNQTIDTQKPLVQQYEQAFERTKAAVTPAQYNRALQKLQFKWVRCQSYSKGLNFNAIRYIHWCQLYAALLPL